MIKTSSTKDIAREIFRKYQIRVSVEALASFAEMLTPIRLKYRSYLYKYGADINNIYYIENGLVCTSHKNEYDGEELVDGFHHEGDIIVPLNLFSESTSRQQAKTIEPTACFALPYHALRQRAAAHPEFNELLFAIFEENTQRDKSYMDLIALNPKERYSTLTGMDSDIIWRNAIKAIANYLRMRSETLSRVRTSLSSKKSKV